MNCPKCGASVDGDAKFCSACGSPLSENQSSESTVSDGISPSSVEVVPVTPTPTTKLDNGVPTIHTEAELEKDPSVSISCDAYHCQIDYCDNDILSLTATPLTNNDCSNISLYVTQYF